MDPCLSAVYSVFDSGTLSTWVPLRERFLTAATQCGASSKYVISK